MSSVSARMIAPPNKRDQRLDMFRGLALAMIFIDHAPGTLYESWTSRNFGFSDAAEAFVLMSGIAAGLAYSTQLATGPLWPAIARVWARARTLYFVHLSTTLMALAIFAAAALWFGIEQPLHTNNIGVVFNQPLGFVIGLPLLTHQLGYFNILPLYLTFLHRRPGRHPCRPALSYSDAARFDCALGRGRPVALEFPQLSHQGRLVLQPIRLAADLRRRTAVGDRHAAGPRPGTVR